MATLKELIAQKVALGKQIADTQQQVKTDGIAKIRAWMTEHELAVADLSQDRAHGKTFGTSNNKKVAPKYIDLETGKTWTGRRVTTKWSMGKDRKTFLFPS